MKRFAAPLALSVIFLLTGSLARADPSSSAPSTKVASRYSSIRQDDETLERDIRQFLSRTKNINSADEGVVSEQVIEHIALPDEPFTKHLRDGSWLVSGSLPHDAQTKGIVIIDPQGHIRAAALLEYVGQRNLVPLYELWIYVRKGDENSRYIYDIDGFSNKSSTFPHKIFHIGNEK